MSKIRRKLITVLEVLMCAALCFSAGLFYSPKKVSASGASDSVGELIKDEDNDNYRIDKSNLTVLFNKLTGVPGATVEDVEDMLQTDKERDAKELTQLNGNTEYTVTFAAKSWIPVYLSKNKSDEVILTLWLTDSYQTSQWNEWMSYDTSMNYPSMMYSTSKIRSFLNGSEYIPKGTSTGVPAANLSVDGVQDNDWKKFVSKFGNVIDSPQLVEWQETETARYSLKGQNGTNGNLTLNMDMPNECWGIPATDKNISDRNSIGWYKGGTMDMAVLYANKTWYGAWKSDTLWIPSLTETGDNSYWEGFWHVSNTQRANSHSKTWLRSGNSNWYTYPSCLESNGLHGDNTLYNTYGVRPAFHLNLTKADAETRKVYFGIDKDGNGVTSESIGGTNVKVASKTEAYSGTEVTVDVLDYDRLKFSTVTNGNVSNVDNIKNNGGKFSAKEPNKADEKIYEIAVTPEEGYYWADATTDSEKKNPETRRYRIKITLADISLTWDDINATVGDSLLQDDDGITTMGSKSAKSVYHKEYDADDYPAYVDAENWADSEWSDNADDFEADAAGYYRVWYKITADFHNTKYFSYTVQVGADDVHISVKGGASIEDITYGDYEGTDFQTWIKGQLANMLEITGNIEYNVTEYLKNLEIVLRDSSNKVVSAQTNGYYAAGTYTVDIKDASKWDTAHPTLTILKKAINVKIVAAKEGDELTHVYGDTPVSMKLEALDKSDFVGEGDFKDNEDSLGTVTFKTDKGELTYLTAADTYKIDADISEINYAVTVFSKPTYKITPREITLKVTDKSVEYGTNLADNPFDMELTDGKIISGSGVTIETLTAGARYYVLVDEAEIPFENLNIGKYELWAEVTNGNYDIKVDPGTLNVTTANFDMSGVSLKNAGYIYDEQPHPAQLSGELPSEEIKYSFRYVNYNTGEDLDGAPVEVGLYIVYASFSHNNSNYNPITTVKAAYIRIAYTQEQLNEAYPPLPSDEDLAAAADLAKKKQEAKKSLDEEANKKKAEIDGNEELTDEEKAKAKSEVDRELEKGNAAIDSATNVSDVNTAFNEGKANIENIKGIHKENSSFPWWIIVVIGAALLLLTLLIIIIVKRRQVADGEDEYDDFYDDEYDFDEEEEIEDDGDFGDDFE